MAYFFIVYLENLNSRGWKNLGQQQLLMIVLAIIIVGIAIAISVQLFRSNAVEAKRDILIEETSSLAAMAIQYLIRWYKL